jgi:two-component system phosphate regulon response regulator PhoB
MGTVRIDRHGHWAYLDEKKLHLTPTEFRLLECFLREPGRAFTRSQLLDVSIGNASFVLERTIDVHIRSLRTKLGAARELIETVRGVGYRFRENEELR